MSDSASVEIPSFYERLVALERAETPFVLVTLVATLGSVPQDIGAKMLVTEAGLQTGTVGGGRVEAQALTLAQEMLAQKVSAPRFVEWTLKGDAGMTCGGAVKFYLEPHPAGAAWWTIVIFGAGHIAQALIPVLAPLPCRILCFDNRPDWLARLPQSRNITARHVIDLAAAVETLPADAFVLCMTQGHKTDRPILQRALATRDFPFIGVIGSAAKSAVLRKELVAAGLPSTRVGGIHCPVGLDFGTNHPHEIALSIAAQLLTERDRPAARNAANPSTELSSTASTIRQ